MTSTDWRRLDGEAADLVRAVAGALPDPAPLLHDLESAEVRHESRWVLAIRTSGEGVGLECPDGPLPVQAFVPSEADYQGEIIVWITDGHLSGLEYAWVTDNPPAAWPRADEMEIRPET